MNEMLKPHAMRQWDYDLGAVLYTSRNTFSKKLDDRWVIYNPDWPGLPKVVSDQAYKILSEFSGGKSVHDVLTSHGTGLDFNTIVEIISFYEETGFLRDAPTKLRYTAQGKPDFSPRNLSVWLHINNHCNLDCSYCFVDKFKATMPMEIIKQTVENLRTTVIMQNPETLQIKFAGGEPTLSIESIEIFLGMLRHSLSGLPVKLHSGIISNGTVVNEKVIRFLKQSGSGIAISLDGFGAESHDLYRVYRKSGRGSWDTIIKNVEKLRDAGLKPSFNVTISQESCSTLPQLVEWMISNRFRFRLSVVRQPMGYFDSTIPLADQHKRMIEPINSAFDEAFKLMERPEYRINLVNNLDICELNFENPVYTSCCGIGHNHIVVQEDGKIASCPMTLREANIQPSQADLVRAISDTISDWNPSDRNNEEANCLDCQWFPVCVSGCPVTNERVKGKPYTISPLHEFYRFVIPRYIEFYGIKLSQAAENDYECHIIEGDADQPDY